MRNSFCLFHPPLRGSYRGLNATSVSKERQVTKRKSPARTFRPSVLEIPNGWCSFVSYQ